MRVPSIAVTLIFAFLTIASAVLKLRHDPNVVRIIHQTVGVPLRYLPLLALYELAGAAGLVAGLWYRPLGVAAAASLAIYFAAAIVAHLRVGDTRGIGPATWMLVFAILALALRVLVV